MNTMTPTERTELLRSLSPVGMQYVAAVRGYQPVFAEDYTYCMLACGDGELLMALAASNPDGRFFGFDGDAALVTAANERAKKLGVGNVAFAQADSLALAKAISDGTIAKPAFDYVVVNLIGNELAENEIATLMTLAQSMLVDDGLFNIAYDVDTKNSGGDLNAALVAYQQSGKVSRTEQAQAAGKKAGLSYVGSARIKANYLDFSAAPATHEPLMQHHGKPYFETLKDFATSATVRHDLWRKGSAAPTDNAFLRFGAFTFSVTSPTSYIDPQYRYFDKKIDFSTPLFTRLINAMSGYPLSLGDMTQHEDLKDAPVMELLSGVQMLVATGVAEPTARPSDIGGGIMNAKLQTSYNQRLRSQSINGSSYLAAEALGRPVYATPTTLMCLKAIDQSGIKGAETVLDSLLAEAPPVVKAEIPANMNDETVRRNMAYRLLEQVCQDWMGFTLLHGIMKAS